MTNLPKTQPKAEPPTIYQIRIEGHLGCEWADWFDGLAISPAGDGETLLTGLVIDQAALYALLRKVRDSGLTLVSVVRIQSDVAHPGCTKEEKK